MLREGDVPNVLSVAVQRSNKRQVGGVPQLHCLVLTSRGDHFVVRCELCRIDKLAVGFHGHGGLADCLGFILIEGKQLFAVPDLHSIVLSGRNKMLAVLRGKINRTKVVCMSREFSNLPNSSMKRLGTIESPQYNFIIFRTCHQENFLVRFYKFVNRNNNIAMTSILFCLAICQVKELKTITVGAKDREGLV